MPIDTTPSTVATSALQAIPFGSLIGGPLDAAIQAQATAAKTTYEFINAVGFDANGKSKNVTFEYQKDGRIVSIIVPVLVIVPIPYIQVDTIAIDFLANISASSSSVSEVSESTAASGEVGVEAKVGWGPFSVTANFKANYSSKKDSKATQESRYSVEYTMSVRVGASQSNMPAGLATVLNILQGSITGSEPGGELSLSPANNTIGTRTQAAYFEAQIKDSNGLLVPEQEVTISLQPATGNLVLSAMRVSPGTASGTPTAELVKAVTDSAGVVGITIGIASNSPASSLNRLKMTASAAIKKEDGSRGPTKTAVSYLNVMPQAALPPPGTPEITADVSELSGAVNATQETTVTLLDADGNPVEGATITATSSDTAKVTVSPGSGPTDEEGNVTFTATFKATGGTPSVKFASTSPQAEATVPVKVNT